jgi:formylglycine-generating enzyme required for sulfatase activity
MQGKEQSDSTESNSARVDIEPLLGEYIQISAGEFLMGSNFRWPSEQPVHKVTIAQDFEMSATVVTQAQWQAIMGSNPSDFKGDNLPVERVSWDDIQIFIDKVNQQSQRYHYRLPTEQEWEYACRAGTTGEYAGELDEMGWYKDNANGGPHEVAKKKPNAWGLYDMHGNVWEWCQEWYKDYPSTDLSGNVNPCRVIRGGSWYFGDDYSRSAFRFYLCPDIRSNHLGFRLVRTPR